MGGNSDKVANFSKCLDRLDKFLVQISWDMALCGWKNSPPCLEGFGTYETSETFRLSTRCHMPGDIELQHYRCESLECRQFDNSCSRVIRYHVLSL